MLRHAANPLDRERNGTLSTVAPQKPRWHGAQGSDLLVIKVSPTMSVYRNARSLVGRAVMCAIALVLLATTALWGHDLFLRLDDYFVQPHTDVRALVLNGTFSNSEAAVTRNRLRSLDLASPHQIVKLDTAAWLPSGDTTVLTFRTGEPGTYLVGASLLPRFIALSAQDFNSYLRSDGLPDVLAERRRSNTLGRPARELYQKHVKAVFQVGDVRTNGFDRVLEYPAEIVPLDNPYTIRIGGSLRIRALVDGRAVGNQLVIWGGRAPNGSRIAQRSVRTDSQGVARITSLRSGVWYVKFIHMVPAPAGDSVDYHSKWATLTFAVRRPSRPE